MSLWLVLLLLSVKSASPICLSLLRQVENIQLWALWFSIFIMHKLTCIFICVSLLASGCTALHSLFTTRSLQVWSCLQIWSSDGNIKLQSVCVFSCWYACCTLSRWIFSWYSSSIVLIFRVATWTSFRIQQGLCSSHNVIISERIKWISRFGFF